MRWHPACRSHRHRRARASYRSRSSLVPSKRLAALIAPDRSSNLVAVAERASQLLTDRTASNINSTARGGGVAEMLQTLLAYERGAGVDTRWLVLRGDPGSFAITKRLHNWLHGAPGDGGSLGEGERAHYLGVMQQNCGSVMEFIRPGDIVLLHDPHTAGLVDELAHPCRGPPGGPGESLGQVKDMAGVLAGFAAAPTPDDVHLLLAVPDIAGVTDDPDGAAVLVDCRSRWRALPATVRSRIQLVCLPMDDVEQNALMVNAIQRRAAVVVPKSLVEGFGLTVTEALWKSRPVIAGAVGGIKNQITDGQQGTLLADPHDLDAVGVALLRMLDDPAEAAREGLAGHERVRDRYLPDRHLGQYFNLFADLMS